MAVARKIAYNVVVNSLLKVTSTVVLSLLLVRLVTGYLGQEGFGKYATVLAFFSFFMAIGDLGLGTVTAREISRHGEKEAHILGRVAGMRILSSFALLVGAPFLVLAFGYSADIEEGILLVALAAFFASFTVFLNGIFQKRIAMDRVVFVEFLGKLIQVTLIALVVKYDLGFLPIVGSVLIALGFNALSVFFLSRRFIRFSPTIDVSFWRSFLRESWPMGATAMITFAYLKMDTILLSLLQTSADVGIYNVAFKILENLVFFPAMLAGLILPLLSRAFVTEKREFRAIANKTFKVFALAVTPLVAGTLFLAPDIVRLIGGSGFSESAPVLRILILSLACIFFGHFFNMLLVVAGEQRRLMKALLFAAFFNISLNYFLIGQLSYIGAAIASFLTEFLVVIITGTLVFRTTKYVPKMDSFWRIALSGVAMTISLFFFQGTPFLVAGLVGVSVYLLSLWLLKAVSSDEIRSLFAKGDEEKEVARELMTP